MHAREGRPWTRGRRPDRRIAGVDIRHRAEGPVADDRVAEPTSNRVHDRRHRAMRRAGEAALQLLAATPGRHRTDANALIRLHVAMAAPGADPGPRVVLVHDYVLV